jgi:hypothetical protein
MKKSYRNASMQVYEYMTEVVKNGKTMKFGQLKITKNKSGVSALITKPNGEKYLMVDMDKLRR